MASKTSRSRQTQHAADTVQPKHTFADVVYASANRTLHPGEWPPASRIYTWAALFAYSLVHPSQFLEWADEKTELSKMMRAAQCPDTQERWWAEIKEKTSYYTELSRLFLFSPLWNPEDLARRVWNDSVSPPRSRKLRCWSANTLPKEGMVRVKWYPSAEAMRAWPEGFGELWVDLPLGQGGTLDLRPAIQLWGMENCFVLDGNRDEPHLLARQPTYELTGLAVTVLLGDLHEVIGIVELPTPLMQDARSARLRAYEFLRSTPNVVSLGETLHDGLRATPDFVMCTILTIFSLLLMIITDSVVLLATKVLWPIIYNTVVRVPLYVVPEVATQACKLKRTVWPWLVAILEAAFLSEKDIEEWESRGAGTRAGEYREDSSDEASVEETV